MMDGAIRVYNTQTLDLEKILHHNTTGKGVFCLINTPMGVLSAAQDLTIKLWNSGSHDRKATFAGLPESAKSITSLVATAHEIWAGCEDGCIYIFNTDHLLDDDDAPYHKPQAAHIQAHNQSVSCLLKVGDQVWSGSADGFIRVWNSNHQLVHELAYHTAGISALANVSEGRVWSASSDKKVVIWNSQTLAVENVLPGDFDAVYDIEPVGMFVWLAARDHLIRMYLTQGIAEDAQRLVTKYCANSISELEEMYAHALEVNEELLFLIRTTFSHMIRAGIVSDAEAEQHNAAQKRRSGRDWHNLPLSVRTTHQANWADGATVSIEELQDRLTRFTRARDAERERTLQKFDLDVLRRQEVAREETTDPISYELRGLRQTLHDCEQAKVTIAQNSKRLQEPRVDATKQLADKRAEYAKFKEVTNRSVKELEDKLAKYQDSAKNYQPDKNRLTPLVAELRAAVDKLNSQHVPLQLRLADAEKPNKALKEETTAKEGEKKAKAAQIAGEQKKKADIDAQIKKIQGSMADLQGKREAKIKAIAPLKEKVQKQTTDLQETKFEQVQLATQLKNLNENVKTQKDRLDSICC
eukprot:gnl/Spiro4/11748_TR6203_c0_g1_i1.p1 gnl/Spiro4/11748_TR6203_c0_g1~~gnl/Spiro4/11748_TR6203_c0_g1_i1.p1  ORF type:complete len:672 (-),score=162.73 gnl/Spiro4/11748_TR6203_c0_g1_i1:63-1811(-)